MANIIGNIPNTTETRFDIASTGKMFTAIMIGILKEEGKLAYGHTINNYLKNFPSEIGEKVTIQLIDLLNILIYQNYIIQTKCTMKVLLY